MSWVGSYTFRNDNRFIGAKEDDGGAANFAKNEKHNEAQIETFSDLAAWTIFETLPNKSNYSSLIDDQVYRTQIGRKIPLKGG